MVLRRYTNAPTAVGAHERPPQADPLQPLSLRWYDPDQVRRVDELVSLSTTSVSACQAKHSRSKLAGLPQAVPLGQIIR